MPSRVSKKKTQKKKVPTIKCQCGVEILLVPDVKLMSKALENHIAEHKLKIPDAKTAEEEAEKIRDDLITQVLKKACE